MQPGQASRARAATGIFPDRKARCCGMILDFPLQTSSRSFAAAVFSFSVASRIAEAPRSASEKFLPVRADAAEIFFAALLRRLSHPKELKQKGKEPRSGSSFPQDTFCKRRSLNDERLLNRSLSKRSARLCLLSHVKVRSIMGDEALNFRVRNGIGCTRFSMDTKEIFQNI